MLVSLQLSGLASVGLPLSTFSELLAGADPKEAAGGNCTPRVTGLLLFVWKII